MPQLHSAAGELQATCKCVAVCPLNCVRAHYNSNKVLILIYFNHVKMEKPYKTRPWGHGLPSPGRGLHLSIAKCISEELPHLHFF